MTRASIAVDATGGDGGIRTVLSGIKLIQDNLPETISLYLCGPADKIQESALDIGLDIKSDQISLIDSAPSPVYVERPSYIWKTHPDSPLVKSINLQKKGLVSASISAGNTAQIISTAIFLLGKQKGVKKTPFGVIFPTVSGRKTLVLDVGANPDCKAEHLADFGSMGADYLGTLMGPGFTPEIKLLNIGIEPEKGNSIIQKADSILRERCPNYTGFIEGDGILAGKADVVVCNGFTGNVLLKTCESFYKLTEKTLSPKKGAFKKVSKEMYILNPENYGAVPLIGVNGNVMKAHGGSSQQAIATAVTATINYVLADSSL